MACRVRKKLTPLLVCILLVALAACSAPDVDKAQNRDALFARTVASPGISAVQLAADVQYLASDALAGRGPGTAGDAATQAYLVERLQSMGFEPGAGAGKWRQPFELIGIGARQPRRWTFITGANKAPVVLVQSRDFIVASGVQQQNVQVNDAELVFVGYGIQAPEYGWDDFKGVDLRGKILVMLNNDPHWDPDLFAGERRLYYGRWVYKYESAARQGAAGAIIIHTDNSAGYPWQVVQTSWSGTQFELPAAEEEPRVQVAAWLTQDASRQLLTDAGFELDQLTALAAKPDFQPVPLGVTTSIGLQNTITRTQSANVVGVLPGSGSKQLREQWVVYSAHHDHIGTVSEVPGADQIYNGARDNAAGTAAVLGIAQAWANLSPKPARSLMVAFVGAEEQGLLGSQYFAKNPPVAPGLMAANVNFDGGNIWGRTRDMTYIGYGKSTLDSVADRVAAYQGRVVKPDQAPDKGYFYRSDQLNFARIGVPALYVNGGQDFEGRDATWGAQQIGTYTAQHYHQPSDEYDASWNFDGMIQDAQFGLMAGVLIANTPLLPTWYAGDEFEAARLRSLAELEGAR